MKRLLLRRPNQGEAHDPSIEAARGRILVDESREVGVILAEDDRLVTASRRARELFEGLEEGAACREPAECASGSCTGGKCTKPEFTRAQLHGELNQRNRQDAFAVLFRRLGD